MVRNIPVRSILRRFTSKTRGLDFVSELNYTSFSNFLKLSKEYKTPTKYSSTVCIHLEEFFDIEISRRHGKLSGLNATIIRRTVVY